MEGIQSEPAPRRIVVVLGMHRSGTSALTRGLQVLGVDLGERLIGAIPGNNDKGFWEDAEINAFDDALLRELGSGWDRLNVIDAAVLTAPALAARRVEAAGLLRSKLAEGAMFAFKDPRTALLLPFWQQVFADLGLEAGYVIAVRNPAEVAQSLARRDGMDLAKGMLLWMKYSVAAVRYTQAARRVFVGYGNLMEHPERQLARVAGALGLPGPAENPAGLLQFTDDFLSPELRHNVLAPGALMDPALIPPMVSDLYALLQELAADAVPGEEFARRWAALEQQYANAAPLLNGLDATGQAAASAPHPAAPPQPAPPARAEPGPQPLRAFRQVADPHPRFRTLVHRWNLESVQDGGAAWQRSGQRLLVTGWVWPTAGGHKVRLATRQNGITRSYALNVARPDVVQAMEADGAGAAGSRYCGFRYTVNVEAGFEVGFEVDGWLFWLYSAEAVTPHEAAVGG